MRLKNYLNESKPKLKKVSEDEYEVILDGKIIGKVHTTWKNPGGNGWNYSPNGINRWFKSRKDAVNAMIKEV